MTWVAVGVGAATAIGGAYSANKAADAQGDGLDQQQAMQAQGAMAYAPYTGAGKLAQRKLNNLLGIGASKSKADLLKSMAGRFTTYTKNKEDDGGFGGTISKSLALGNADLGRQLADPLGLGVGDMLANAPAGYTAHVDTKALNKAVKKRLAKQEVTRSKDSYGMLTKEFTGEDLQNEPGYLWRLQQGQDSVAAGQAARGNLFSGAAGKELLQYGQGFASNEYGNAYSRDAANKARLYDMFSNVANRGQSSAAGQANQYNMIGDTYANMGANRASGYMGQANALSQGIGTGLNYWQQQSAMPKSYGSNPINVSASNTQGLFPVRR